MKVEIITNRKFNKISKDMEIDARCLYRCPEDVYEVWEVEKSEIKDIETACTLERVLFCYSDKSGMGTPYSFLTIRGDFMIGWVTIDGKEKYNCFTDYCKDGLGVTSAYEVCALAIDLCKANGMTPSKFFALYEG